MNNKKCLYCTGVIENGCKECSRCGAPNADYNVIKEREVIYVDVGNVPHKELSGFIKGVKAVLKREL